MQKIVHIIYSGLGGHFSVTLALIEADIKKKYDHCVIFYGIENLPEMYLEKCEERHIPFVHIKKEPGFDSRSLNMVLKSLEHQRPDIILLNSVNLILTVAKYKFRKKVKLIGIEHQANELKTKKEWIWSVLLMRLSKRVVYLTDSYRDQMRKKLGLFYKSGKVSVINNGININVFRPYENSGVDMNFVSIGMLSRLTSNKAHKTLLEAFMKIRKYYKGTLQLKLFIAGDGETRNSLEKIAQELQLHDSIAFTGMLSENESADFLNRLTIYVHSSYGETMSTAIMQAMACAKPTIATDVNGINNMIEHNVTGILVPVEDVNKMFEALKSLIDNVAWRRNLGITALEYAKKKFSNTTMLADYEKIFQD